MKEFENFINHLDFKISESKAKEQNALVFAFVGDAVFTLFVRSNITFTKACKAGQLHTLTSKIVRASAQAYFLEKLQGELKENESDVVRIARNMKTNNVAKNSNLEEYKKSTSFEALLGYLYLTNQTERLLEILNKCIELSGEIL